MVHMYYMVRITWFSYMVSMYYMVQLHGTYVLHVTIFYIFVKIFKQSLNLQLAMTKNIRCVIEK
jgi:hypothetical protein